MSELLITQINQSLLKEVARSIQANKIILIIDKQAVQDIFVDISLLKDLSNEEGENNAYHVQILSEDKETVELSVDKTASTNPDAILRDIISTLIKKKHLKQDMKLLIATNQTINKKYNLSLNVVEVDRMLYRIGKFRVAENMTSETVIETIIEIAQEIGQEGREGKKVGTLVVIGEPDELKAYSKQLIMNPFHGYSKDMLNVLENSHLSESIKNFAQLDGCFTVDNEGNLMSAGTYLDVDTSEVKPYQGWGTKHLAAVAITQVTSSVAVLVSESGGAVKVFKNGKLILRLH
jgi:DNA integrity scanning protein DisA with diadenylate cyclase activity